ncbi:MAG: general secretion pathway protein B [Halieaceae bacterium]|jgi:general secretion pathway protein B
MSLILDALNRSEAERRGGGAVPGLATEHFVGGNIDATGRFSMFSTLPWIVLVLVVAAAVIAWVLLADRGSHEAPLSSAHTNLAEGKANSVVSVQRGKPAEIVRPATSVASPDSLPAITSPAAIRSAAVDDEAASDVAALYGQPAGAEVGSGVTAGADPPAKQTDAESVDMEKILAQAQSEIEDASLQAHPAPFLAGLSQQRKDQIPTIMYSVHNYSGRPSESTVVLNGRSTREGVGLSGGIKVVEILPDSVVLEFQGEQFRLRALNSWVNL